MNSDTKPYPSKIAPADFENQRSTGWLMLSGAILLGLAGGCLLVTCVGMMFVFDGVAQSSATPTATELATGMHWALVPAAVSAPLVVLGAVLVLVGVIRRRN
ncbi:MAG: hypothetical protein VB878_00925 [Pirellulaceae bacterium]